MDGIHDLGGKQGFGPIEVEHSYQAFQHDWEGRVWAIDQIADDPTLTLDWWRHIVERLDPATYLTIPYFEKWLLTYMTRSVMSGIFTVEEVLEGRTDTRGPRPEPRSIERVLDDDRALGDSFRQPTEATPLFADGQKVSTLRHGNAGHTRLPAYARGRTGHVIAVNGAHPLPDLSARGIEEPQYLYTVSFSARELWGPDASENDTVRLDLWESYLVST